MRKALSIILTGFGIHGSLTSHNLPVNPGGHEHMKPLPLVMQ